MQVRGDALVNKLILSENTILDMCCSANNWISYMDCKPLLGTLLDHSFIYNTSPQGGSPLYSITPDGRVCLADFYVQIPSSLREEISAFVKNNRTRYRKSQQCAADYFMNKDGTYTVYLKILEPNQPIFELKLVVPNRQTAKNIYRKWEEKAANVYATVYDCLVD